MDGDAYPLFPILPQSHSIVLVVVARRFLSLHTHTHTHTHKCFSRVHLSRVPFHSFFQSDPPRTTKVTPRMQDSLLRTREFNPLRPRTRGRLMCYSMGLSDPLKRTPSNFGSAMIYRAPFRRIERLRGTKPRL